MWKLADRDGSRDVGGYLFRNRSFRNGVDDVLGRIVASARGAPGGFVILHGRENNRIDANPIFSTLHSTRSVCGPDLQINEGSEHECRDRNWSRCSVASRDEPRSETRQTWRSASVG
jgi:hypothetical protein